MLLSLLRPDGRILALDSWLRDSFQCLSCGSIPRQRALMTLLERHYPAWKDLRIHESSPNPGGRFERECRHYLASQFYPGRPPGEMIDGYRNEDLERQTFPDSAFDLVITQDDMEHVYDPLAAFDEIARTLKPGGAHILTVALVNKHRPSEVWATRAPDGSPIFVGEPEFHGNPVDPRGAPVTMHWGFDIVQTIARSGLTTTIEHSMICSSASAPNTSRSWSARSRLVGERACAGTWALRRFSPRVWFASSSTTVEYNA